MGCTYTVAFLLFSSKTKNTKKDKKNVCVCVRCTYTVAFGKREDFLWVSSKTKNTKKKCICVGCTYTVAFGKLVVEVLKERFCATFVCVFVCVCV